MQKFLFLFVVAILAWHSPAAQQPAPGNAQGATPANSAPKPPQAKTPQEFKDYNAANAATGGSASEKAANHFAGKHPDSELRVYLYAKAMHAYQTENNAARILDMGDKVLAIDPDHAVALVLTATVLADSLGNKDDKNDKDSAQERESKIARVRTQCTKALSVLNPNFTVPGATPEQANAFRDTLRSMTFSAQGIMELKSGNDAAAEHALRSASTTSSGQSDPYVWYHLALALDHQNRYSEALVSVDHALKFVGANVELEELARNERNRLAKLTGAKPAPPATAPEGAGKKPR